MNQPITLQDEFLAAAIELREIAKAKTELLEREAACKRLLRKALAEGERGAAPDGTELVAVRRGSMRFSADRARETLPPDILGSIQVFTPDSRKAKDVLAPALYELCCESSTPSVVVL